MLYRRFFLVTLFAALLGLLTSNLLNATAQRDHDRGHGFYSEPIIAPLKH